MILPGQRFLTWPLTSLEIKIFYVPWIQDNQKILGSTAGEGVQSLFTRDLVYGPQRPDRMAPWLRLDYPGRPQESLTALRYNQVKGCTGAS
ncbi:hypothetical protein ES703_117333 [subsurface metagenome]